MQKIKKVFKIEIFLNWTNHISWTLSIDRFNLLVPMLNSQMVHFNLEKESENISKKEIENISKKVIQNLTSEVQNTKPKAMDQNDNCFTILIKNFFKK